MRAHVGIRERFAWTRNRTVKAAHEADLCPVIHPVPIGVVDEYAEALLLRKVLEDAAPEGECHCHTILVVLGGSAITGLGSRASGWLRLMFEGRPGIDAEGAEQEPEKDSAEIAGPLRLCILEDGRSERQCGQSTAAMRTGSAQNEQSLMPLAGITIPTVCLGRNMSKTATGSGGSDDNHWSDHHCVCPVIVTVDHPVTSLIARHCQFSSSTLAIQESADLPLWVSATCAAELLMSEMD